MRYPKGCRYIIGVDEAGRGPLAGSVSVAAVLLPVGYNMRKFNGVTDAKKLTPLRRSVVMDILKEERKKGILNYACACTGPGGIDEKGIVRAVEHAMYRALYKLNADPKMCFVLLDGSLKAPKKFTCQKTVIRGDEKLKTISLASVVAKVSRDRKMIRLAKRYPLYGFEQHKGYGTKMHYRQIRKYGLSDIHRRSFLKRLILD
jgi:ribonuclease HII